MILIIIHVIINFSSGKPIYIKASERFVKIKKIGDSTVRVYIHITDKRYSGGLGKRDSFVNMDTSGQGRLTSEGMQVCPL